MKRRKSWGWRVAVLIALWPVIPMVIATGALGETYSAALQLERLAVEQPAPPLAKWAPPVKQAATALATLRSAAWWLGLAYPWPVVGSAAKSLWDAVSGAADVSQAAADLAQAAADAPAHQRVAVTVQTAVADLPLLASGLHQLEGAPPLLRTIARAVRQAAPLVQAASAHRRAWARALGFGGPARYLLLLQDAAELRPTGGFLAAYGYVVVRRGHLSLQYAGGLRPLSKQVAARPSAGPILRQCFDERTLSLINANIDPNGPGSAAAILALYRSVPGAPPVRGVILVNSWWVDQLFRLSGPITVRDGARVVTLTASNAPYQMEWLAERARPKTASRMAFLGPVLRTLAKRLMPDGVPTLRLAQAVWRGLNQENVLWEPEGVGLEQWAVRAGWAAAIDPGLLSANYLLVVNDNLGGLKDNLYLTQHVRLAVAGRDERLTVTLVLPHPVTPSNAWLVGSYEGYLQVFLPPGTRLIADEGFVGPVVVGTNRGLDKLVVGGRVSVPAERTLARQHTQLTLDLRLPRRIAKNAPLLLQVEPGWRPEADIVTVSEAPAPPVVLAPTGAVWIRIVRPSPARHRRPSARVVVFPAVP